jgi:hypothetical protein
MKKLLLLALFFPSATLLAQIPDCQFAVTFVGAGRQGTSAAPGSPTAFPATSTPTGTPCNTWRVSYQTAGSVVISLSFQGVNAIGLSPGSTFITMGPACLATNPCTIITGTNPMTNGQDGFLSVNGYFPFVSLLMNSCAGCSATSNVQVKVMGFRNGSSVSSSGGGTGTVVGPAMSTDGFVPQWSGNTGTILSAGLPVTSVSGTPNALIETTAAGAFPPSFGLVTGPLMNTANFIPQWVGTSGTQLGNGFLVTNTGGGSNQIPLTVSSGLDTLFIPPPRTNSGPTRVINRASEIFFCTAACTITPLVPSSGPASTGGQGFCVRSDDNLAVVITLAAIPGVAYENTSRTSYKAANTPLVSSGLIGDQICMIARSLTQYAVFSFSGTWN